MRLDRNAITFWGAMSALWLGGAAASPGLDLVKDGQPVATVVVSIPRAAVEPAKPTRGRKRAEEAGENEEALAAGVLVDWIKKITDVELPVAATAPAGAPAIFIGKAAVQAGLKLDDIPSPSREGVRISADGQRVLIGGQSDPATLKAVCRFLEELGCRYFMDGPLGEVYPRSRTLSVPPLAITESPGLLERNPKGPSWRATLWKAWNGAGGETFNHSHSWGRYLPKELFDQHPEYFAMGADGQRKRGDWPCTSNQDLRKVFAQNVIATIEAGQRHPSISPPDGRGYCQCPACQAQDDPKSLEPSSGTVSISSRYADFFDDIGRRVAAVHPESVLSFYCYADYTQPPTLLTHKLSTNLCAVIAPIRYCRIHEIGHPGCPSRMQQTEMVDGWAAVASRIGYYNYMYDLADGTLPFFKFTACQKEFPYLKDKGLSYMTIEVLSNWQIYGPQIYLSLRLAYQPKADAAALMEDYWQKFYGPRAAPFMKEYWMGLDAAQGRLTSHAGSFFGLQQIFTPEFLKQCETALARAAEAARGDERYAQRVGLHTAGFRSAVAYRGICDAMSRGDFAAAQMTYDELIGRLRLLASQHVANGEYGTAYLERFLSKTIHSGAAATAPPHRLLQVLPERWRFALDEADRGLTNRYETADFDDSRWPLVSTYEKTLDTQGFAKETILWYRSRFTVPEQHGALTLFFGEVDGLSEVYVNGARMNAQADGGSAQPGKNGGGKTNAPSAWREGQVKSGQPFTAEITGAVHPGENVVALRADHTKLTDLSLGGILRPVLLVETPER